MNLREYITQFEREVARGIILNNTDPKMELIPIRPGKLARTKFALFIGNIFPDELIFAIDYYGFFKKSTGFEDYVLELRGKYPGEQIKAISASVVHFAAIKIETVAECAPTLLADFIEFKQVLLKLRGFKN